MHFSVVRPEFPFARCLDDLADCLVHALRGAGHDVKRRSSFDDQGQPSFRIVLGAHHKSVALPEHRVIVYQTEVPGTAWFTPGYLARLNNALAVWHAAPEFADHFKGRPHHMVVEPGLVPTEPAVVEKTLDVLFYGSMSDRRVRMLEALVNAGIGVEAHFNLFGEKRNTLIDRSRIVLDIKQRDGDPDDRTRTFFLDSRGACVLSENDPDPRRRLLPERIVEQCRTLLAEPAMRTAHAKERRAELRTTDVSAAVAELVNREQAILHHHV